MLRTKSCTEPNAAQQNAVLLSGGTGAMYPGRSAEIHSNKDRKIYDKHEEGNFFPLH